VSSFLVIWGMWFFLKYSSQCVSFSRVSQMIVSRFSSSASSLSVQCFTMFHHRRSSRKLRANVQNLSTSSESFKSNVCMVSTNDFAVSKSWKQAMCLRTPRTVASHMYRPDRGSTRRFRTPNLLFLLGWSFPKNGFHIIRTANRHQTLPHHPAR
jgi:hypothetical protein